ncbi:type I glyceraldehyde-3-phosphate dehydrogenase [Pollutimonas bauzanensis]|uniref:D-erythrose 4-phosphate dehydrogenase n=1 Tax=Pollutimonas bauzanensis TaxID=658167 RepID=A0A1M5W661_9BURK|nr:glyceraldehyde 3-phosphate dehydrogenase NAD-binding domain-containing protein [Pollutimonas bauzanensis]SHH83012.1 D-erythrose 4-phosphate dehydrogenase [Pollutimonas bauzanensis]
MSRPIRLAINGYGRIGRCVLRALYESPLKDRFQIVAINEPADLATMAYLSQFDSTHGVFPGKVEQGADCLVVNGKDIRVSHARTPEEVDWRSLGIDILLECSGQYGARDEIQRFIDAGCPRVLVSQPGRSAQDVDFTVVFGINHEGLSGGESIVSNASCTTNAIVPVLSALDDAYGIDHAFLTTLHSVMNDQPLLDGYHHADLRRTRSAMQSIVPVATGLAQGVERLLPQLAGKVQAKAIRVPILNVSAIDLMVKLGRDIAAPELNALLMESTNRYPGLLAYSNNPHASVDFNHNPHSAIIDGSQTRTNGDGFANLFVWFDNEWGFANRMLDVAGVWSERFQGLLPARREGYS